MSSPPEQSLEIHRTVARQQAQRGELDAAEKSFLSLLDRQPQDDEALTFVADRQSARGEHAAAIQRLRVAVHVQRAEPAVWVQLASAQLAAGDFAAAAA